MQEAPEYIVVRKSHFHFQAIRLDIMLHAYMLAQSGIPMLYSGDEIGQLNDYSYKEDPDKAGDSRYIHRGRFKWDLAEKRSDNTSVQGKIFGALNALENIRKKEIVFEASANVYTYDVHNDAILCIMREMDGEGKFSLDYLISVTGMRLLGCRRMVLSQT